MSKAKKKTISKKDRRQDETGGSQLKTATGGEKRRFIVSNPGSAVELLPPEVLELIFENVESSKDLLSCWKTNGATSAWATALRTTDFYFKMTLPFIMPYTDGNDMLNCSSVSKPWNAAVDSCIQSAEEFDSYQELYSGELIVNKLHAEYLPDFINTFGLNDESGDKVAVSPLPFRRTEVNTYLYKTPIGRREREEQQQKYPNEVPLSFVRNNLIKCLDHHGHLIQHLKLTLNGSGGGPEGGSCQKKLNLIRICLKRTPNLRELHISANYCPRNRTGTPAEFQVSNSNYNWPPLKHLKVLDFGDSTNRTVYASIANAYAPQLVQLQFGFKLKKPHRPLSNKFSCLQRIEYLFHEAGNGMEFAAFIQSNQCPLKHLTIVFSWPDGEAPEMDKVIGLTNAANAASATLETLLFHPRASQGNGINFDITKFDGLRLPKLKRLTLSSFGYPSLEFLQSVCPSIQTLYLHPNLPEDKCPTMPNARMYADLYFEHNFWTQLGAIEKVDVEYNVPAKTVVVDGVRRKIEGGTIQKVYTRRAYDAKGEKRRVMEIDGQEENQSSSSDEENFLDRCYVKAPHGGSRLRSKTRRQRQTQTYTRRRY